MNAEAATAFLREAATYFGKRPTGGEDAAHWSNVYNAENCRKAADLIAQQAAQIERMREGLEPFGDIADLIESETEGMDQSDEVQLMYHDYLMERFTVAQFFAARAALNDIGGGA